MELVRLIKMCLTAWFLIWFNVFSVRYGTTKRSAPPGRDTQSHTRKADTSTTTAACSAVSRKQAAWKTRHHQLPKLETQWQDHGHRLETVAGPLPPKEYTVAGPLPPSGNSGRTTATEWKQWQEHCHREESVAGTLPPIGHTAAGPLLPSGNSGRTTATDW